jgi:hypothetical protein
MLLNIFFDKMNGKLELVLIGAFIFAIYWFILRKYNALGLRLFVLCFLLFIASCVWLYKDEKNLSNTLNKGEEHIATIIAKAKTGKDNNEVEVSFTALNGKNVQAKTSEYVSVPEWEKFETGKPVSVMYIESTNQVFIQQSIMRFKADKIYLYYFSGFWLLLGLVLLITLRKLKVKVDENTGAEWVEKEGGSVIPILDDRKMKGALTMKKLNIVSKMLQSFAK